ncbi:TIR domain-containing protein [Vibrio parahaemolyticus]
MDEKIIPHGFNEKSQLARRALLDYVYSDYFHGVVSPGSFYEFCQSESSYSEIDSYFFNRWIDLDLGSLCDELNVKFRKSKPKNTSEQSAARTVAEMITVAKTCPEGGDVKRAICESKGQTRDVVSSNLNRCIGLDNLKYLLSIDFDINEIPNLNRSDLKEYFTLLRKNNLENLNGFVGFIRANIKSLVEFNNCNSSKRDVIKVVPDKKLKKDTNFGNSKIEIYNMNNKVFIVHGHDELAKLTLARFLEQLGLEPIILHEKASSSKTIIEKIESYSDVGYAIVLYTPCDSGAKIDSELMPRARQNVVFEHGYFIGKLGRSKVTALVKGTLETPNDISGVVYIDLDERGAWKNDVAKELNAAGYSLNLANVILG